MFRCRGGWTQAGPGCAVLSRPCSGGAIPPLHRSHEAGECWSLLRDRLGAANPCPWGFGGWELCVLRAGPAPLGAGPGGWWVSRGVPTAGQPCTDISEW